MVYGLNSYVMVFLFRRGKGKAGEMRRRVLASFDPGKADLPMVTTQIPLYNEYNVAERVIRAVCAITYPGEKHYIQVLDDSDDETSDLVDGLVDFYSKKGHAITCIRRNRRTGFKAGALQEGLSRASGEFVAIFDADFVPPQDFLFKTIPFFLENKALGLVQARWGHHNAGASRLTRAQALGIDGHFMVEQAARNFSGLFMNFNGTAGIFRTSAILDAGGWQCDTLTEDMDLSYRMQLAGWEALYTPDLVIPGEIPEDVRAFRSQQYRWAKGSMETAIKLLPAVFRSKIPRFMKIQAFFHMTHYMVHPLMLISALLALPVMQAARGGRGFAPFLYTFLALVFVLSMSAPSVLYLAARQEEGDRWSQTLRVLPWLMVIGTGIAVSNSRAVVEALLGRKTGFVRTPKKGDQVKKTYKIRLPVMSLFELVLGIYCLYSFFMYLHCGRYLVGPFLAIYAAGFLFTAYLTLRPGHP
jgi:cellulose synthase/poly-beta-1,6-N-acetylglucosamine synthase-like glycosyltransferase